MSTALQTNGGTSQIGMLGVADVGRELLISPIEVKRLISRGRITATRMNRNDSAPGEYRILADEGGRFIRAGALDLRAPFNGQQPGAWPSLSVDGGDWCARQFLDAILKASSPQKLADNELVALLKGDQFATSFQVPIKHDDAVKKILRSPVPQNRMANPAGRRDQAALDRFGTWARLFLVRELQLVSRDVVPLKSLESLYGGPEEYAGHVSETISRTLARKYSWSEWRRDTRQASSEKTVTIQHVLVCSTFTNERELRALADQFAF